jgi:hypothetical protein
VKEAAQEEPVSFGSLPIRQDERVRKFAHPCENEEMELKAAQICAALWEPCKRNTISGLTGLRSGEGNGSKGAQICAGLVRDTS